MSDIQYRGSRDELNSRLTQLDAIADRLGALYQRFGRLQHEHAIQDDDVTIIMDEMVQLTEDIETIGGRKARHTKTTIGATGMQTLVEQLRNVTLSIDDGLMREAADRIQALEAALHDCMEWAGSDCEHPMAKGIMDVASKALVHSPES